MNNKGYSALEILAIIVIVGMFSLLATTKISHAFSDNPDNLYKSEQKLILSIAKNYGMDHIEEIKEHKNSRTISIDDLVVKGYLNASNDSGDYLDPRDNNRVMNDINIKIIYDEEKDEIETKIVE